MCRETISLEGCFKPGEVLPDSRFRSGAVLSEGRFRTGEVLLEGCFSPREVLSDSRFKPGEVLLEGAGIAQVIIVNELNKFVYLRRSHAAKPLISLCDRVHRL